jgi:hypothetical protein
LIWRDCSACGFRGNADFCDGWRILWRDRHGPQKDGLPCSWPRAALRAAFDALTEK